MPKTNQEILRVTRSKEDAKISYDKLSKWYDMIAGSEEKKFRKIGLKKLNVIEGERTLEIGFGTGRAALALAKSVGETGKVYGIDISRGMFDISQARIAKAGLSERVDLRCADAANLPYTDNFFDALFISFTLELFDTPDIQPVLQQCKNVLKIGGRLCVVSMLKEEKPGFMAKLYHWGHLKFPNYIDCRPIYVSHAIKDAEFLIADVTKMSSWGLPVEIVLAKKV